MLMKNLFTTTALLLCAVYLPGVKGNKTGAVENQNVQTVQISPEKAKAIADWIKVLDARSIEQAEGCDRGSCLDVNPDTGVALCPKEEAVTYNYVTKCLKTTTNPYTAHQCYKIGALSDSCRKCITGCLRLRAYTTCLGVVDEIEGSEEDIQ